MSKIELTDTVPAVIVKMSEGNMGAATAIMNILEVGGVIDPDSAFGGMGAIFSLDQMGIYGSGIWVLYSDVCEKNAAHFLAIFRAHGSGWISDSTIIAASSRQDFNGKQIIPVKELYDRVVEWLPAFDKAGRGIFE